MGRQAEGPGLAWGFLGLTAAMLSSSFLQTQALTVPITKIPQTALLGRDILLIPGGAEEFVLCNWYRGRRAEANLILTYVPVFSPPEEHRGVRYTGRESSGPGGFLLIRKLMVNDTEKYIATKTTSRGIEVGIVDLEVQAKRPGR